MSHEQQQELIIDALQNLKAQNIIKLDFAKLENAPCKSFLICEGTSTTHVSAIASAVERKLREVLKERPRSNEGGQVSEWVLLDYFDIIIHIFLPDVRRNFDLEGLWGDAKLTQIEE